MNLLSILLQATTTATSSDSSGLGSIKGWVMMFAIVAIVYFFMIRPQTKRQKDLQKAREAMQPGDKVVTSGGIFGKIKEVNDTNFLIEIADNVRVKVDKASVYAVPNAPDQQK